MAIYLDRLADSHIIGTVAGDDAIMIIPDAHSNVERVVSEIRDIMT